MPPFGMDVVLHGEVTCLLQFLLVCVCRFVLIRALAQCALVLMCV